MKEQKQQIEDVSQGVKKKLEQFSQQKGEINEQLKKEKSNLVEKAKERVQAIQRDNLLLIDEFNNYLEKIQNGEEEKEKKKKKGNQVQETKELQNILQEMKHDRKSISVNNQIQNEDNQIHREVQINRQEENQIHSILNEIKRDRQTINNNETQKNSTFFNIPLSPPIINNDNNLNELIQTTQLHRDQIAQNIKEYEKSEEKECLTTELYKLKQGTYQLNEKMSQLNQRRRKYFDHTNYQQTQKYNTNNNNSSAKKYAHIQPDLNLADKFQLDSNENLEYEAVQKIAIEYIRQFEINEQLQSESKNQSQKFQRETEHQQYFNPFETSQFGKKYQNFSLDNSDSFH
eukprot:TRINITY_DN4282_c0_g1_i3.p1 TRINITY_DN4282_c0_g1~~TRINITY_DN4282_c0_g1_i3.p1  ORF type:complete len:345 (-),score=74.24 TRINITY_DN4282_c0_g1_i3:181-1215(-)